ncbi:hypothetical protein CTAYLR_007080 [Chrysophaeum taylorii]|uniref:Uncharacterized protein n=1 Tax=Chrysophaeum taylorii TaxID=2483200 RepID=A0AAD7UKY5_9STRA|nr:hypothetical protein CTAYLR_007080 [Chrysophaeum taylorii]
MGVVDCEERFITMSLGSRGPATIPNRVRHVGTHVSNRLDDIDGAKPELKYLRYTSRPDFYRTEDIDGTAPMKLHKKMSRAEDDRPPIEGSVPKRTLFRTSRLVNPLDPDYKLPSCTPAEPFVPRYVRDSFEVKDIEGTAPRARFRFSQRKTHACDDIEGTRSGWRPRNERVRRDGPPVDFMNVKDINDIGFKTRRTTDPLRPTHRINGMCIKDDMVKTMPKKLPKATQGPFFPLHTQDIDGAQCGWKPPHAIQPPLDQRRHFRNTNYVGDIQGAQSDSVRYAIRTERKTNPLNPNYKSLDGNLLADPTKPDFSHLLAILNANKKREAAKPASGVALRSNTAPAEPSSRREAAQREADVAAVRALP